jgi:hypothetical protein
MTQIFVLAQGQGPCRHSFHLWWLPIPGGNIRNIPLNFYVGEARGLETGLLKGAISRSNFMLMNNDSLLFFPSC